MIRRAPLVLVFVLATVPVVGQVYLPDTEGVVSAVGTEHDSPYAGRDFPTEVLWGDTHLHTAVSVDAGIMCTPGQEEAFRFAGGEEVSTAERTYTSPIWYTP